MSARIAEAVRTIADAEVLLIATDFDGTISHLADEPMSVRAVPEAKVAIERLSHLEDTYVAYVSGRQIRDLLIISERPDVSPILVAGSHGAEYLIPSALAEPEQSFEEPGNAAAILANAEEAIAELPGVKIEPKRFGFALHTRTADEHNTSVAEERVGQLMREEAASWRRRDGRDVVEFAWRHDGKDSAVAYLREVTGATAVLFAGDDVTDEDAIRSLGPQDLGVRVGDGETAAGLRVRDPEEFAAVLTVIASIREGRGQ